MRSNNKKIQNELVFITKIIDNKWTRRNKIKNISVCALCVQWKGEVENILKMIVCYVYTTSVTLNLMKVSMSE